MTGHDTFISWLKHLPKRPPLPNMITLGIRIYYEFRVGKRHRHLVDNNVTQVLGHVGLVCMAAHFMKSARRISHFREGSVFFLSVFTWLNQDEPSLIKSKLAGLIAFAKFLYSCHILMARGKSQICPQSREKDYKRWEHQKADIMSSSSYEVHPLQWC